MIIDVHVHSGQWLNASGAEVKTLIAKMDASGIDVSIVNSPKALTEQNPSGGNKEVFEIVCQYPDRFMGMAAVNPYHGEIAEKELNKCLSHYEFKGLKLHPWIQGYPAHSEITYALLDICEGYNVPVLFHSGTPPYAQVMQIAYLAHKYPRVKFILGHMGLTYQWRQAIEAAKIYDNVFLDTSGITYPFAITKAINEAGVHKVLFGTDNPFLDPQLEILKIKNLHLKSDQWEAIMYKNAEKLFLKG